jgi:hypothetical protein
MIAGFEIFLKKKSAKKNGQKKSTTCVDSCSLQKTWFAAYSGCQAVDKQLDIHSTRCAKARFLEDCPDLSPNLPVWIPSFYRHFQGCQVLDPVGKIGLIHKKIDVYYYYQNIYIQLNLKQ